MGSQNKKCISLHKHNGWEHFLHTGPLEDQGGRKCDYSTKI